MVEKKVTPKKPGTLAARSGAKKEAATRVAKRPAQRVAQRSAQRVAQRTTGGA